MIKINLNINIDKPKWWYRIFRCRHQVVLVEENFHSRYGTHTSYAYCLKCGRKTMDIERNCRHEVDIFGVCQYCLARQEKFDCSHKWVNEPDTDDYYCDECGEWKIREGEDN